MPTKPMDPKARIARATAVNKSTGCWEWQLGKDQGGYGKMNIQLGKRGLVRHAYAHRFAYELFVGPIPKGLYVLHRCDNPGCCNPDHLFIGTQAENIQDMLKKGRGRFGPKRPAIKGDSHAG